MYSSDSDDDFYGDVIKKRDKLLSYYEAKHKEGLLDNCVGLNEVEEKNDTTTKTDVIKRGKAKRKSVDSSIPSKRGRKSGKLTKIDSITSPCKDASNSEDCAVNAFIDLTECDFWANSNNTRRRSTRLQSALQNESNDDVILLDVDYDSSDTNSQNKRGYTPNKKSTRGASTSIESPRGRSSRGRGTSRGNSNSRGNSSRGNTKSRGTSRGRNKGRGRGRAKTMWGRDTTIQSIISQFAINRSTTNQRTSTQRRSQQYYTNSIPTFSIGNTEEYDDELENVQIFSSPSKKYIESNDLDKSFENEELSVKVCWQSVKIHKFNIRRFQKIKEIYDSFMKKENLPITNLVFMYNDQIISPDDSPDSIGYKITEFIEGGIIDSTNNVNVLKVVKKSGVEIKFQCEKVKKPVIVYMDKDEKFSIAMIKCAEELEIPLKKLKFEFDGDIITGSETLQSLDMEGGECIDVKIIN